MKFSSIKKIVLLFLVANSVSLLIFWQLGYFAKPSNYNIQLIEKIKIASPVPIGAAVDSYRLENDTAYRDLVLNQFNSIVAESQMKMKNLMPSSDSFQWYHSDYLVNFAYSNGMVMHGHTLLWHGSVPEWLENFQGSDSDFEQIIKTYIQTVVSRYKGKITSWDVVNEAFDGAKYRDTIFYRRMGPEYIKKAFIWAHDSDPSIKLYYNDYSMLGQDPAKVDYIIQEIGKLVNDSIPVQGIGIQGHLKYDTPTLASVNLSLQKWMDFGLEIRISEMDIAMNYDGKSPVFTNDVAELQKQRYHDLVSLFLKCPSLAGITLWGVSDAHTWLPDHQGHRDWPLLFDVNYNPKPAAEGFLNALQEI